MITDNPLVVEMLISLYSGYIFSNRLTTLQVVARPKKKREKREKKHDHDDGDDDDDDDDEPPSKR